LQLFVSATNVRTGELHVFRREEMTADMIVASACLPHFSRGRDRWRVVLGRRLCRESGALPADRCNRDREPAAGPDQPIATQAGAEDARRNPGADQRDYVQLLTDVRAAWHHVRRKIDRRGQAAARYRCRAIPED